MRCNNVQKREWTHENFTLLGVSISYCSVLSQNFLYVEILLFLVDSKEDAVCVEMLVLWTLLINLQKWFVCSSIIFVFCLCEVAQWIVCLTSKVLFWEQQPPSVEGLKHKRLLPRGNFAVLLLLFLFTICFVHFKIKTFRNVLCFRGILWKFCQIFTKISLHGWYCTDFLFFAASIGGIIIFSASSMIDFLLFLC